MAAAAAAAANLVPGFPPWARKKANDGPHLWMAAFSAVFVNVSCEPECQMFAIEIPVRRSSRALRYTTNNSRAYCHVKS